MNGDNKDEAQRPRPLSAGIWTLFSWLRRSERSSSSESLSSVGSARTAVSFDFLAPGNCNITNTPIVLTTPLNPPSETYKRRLHERNLRRQYDRDITLHRKYGLYRENGNGYDGFSLPPARRTLGSNVDRSNRDRRATSECLQRRAAYVPGKRRAPLPPAIATSVSLPRTYKRKRPAPKPPIKNTFKDNNNTQPINNPTRMNSNSGPDSKLTSDNGILRCNKTEKCDNKVINSRDTKSKTERNFLKHIFENKKRSSVTDTASVRLLPSISELDKQAAEIIENNKLQQNKNKLTSYDTNSSRNKSPLYEGNSWFCTSCLRKYDSSINTCNYCLPDTSDSIKEESIKMSPRSSIYTQTNSIMGSATSSQSNMDERKRLKEILKEMKDSLPKKNKVKDFITETPTLRIGSTIHETYKDLASQPSTSTETSNDNRILSISSLLSGTQRSNDSKNYIIEQRLLSNGKSLDALKTNKIQHKINLEFNNNSNNSSKKNDQHTENRIANTSSILLSENTKSECNHAYKIHTTNVTGNYSENTQIKSPVIKENTNNIQSQAWPPLNKSNDNKGMDKHKPFVHATVTNDYQHFVKDRIKLDNISNNQSKLELTSPTTNISTKTEKKPQMLAKSQFLNMPNSHVVVVNSVTVVTSPSNNKSSETSIKIPAKDAENKCVEKLEEQNEARISDSLPLGSKANPDSNNRRIVNETEINSRSTRPSIDDKPESALHTPLRISSLLNPPYSPRLTIIKENKSSGPDVSKHIKKEIHSNSNAFETIDNNKSYPKEDKKILENVTPLGTVALESIITNQGNDITEPIKTRETANLESINKNEILRDVSYEKQVLPSTSGCSSTDKNNSNNNLNKFDNYDQRRHIINQLEQSIAKGDEVAAAEAAVKLAKLKLSCSVLSFSSQIVRETSKAKKILLATSISSPTDKPMEESVSRVKSEDTIKVEERNEQLQKIETNNKLLQNKTVSKDITESNKNLSYIKPRLLISEPSASSSSPCLMDDIVAINLWIEDKKATRGPIQLQISRRANMTDIKRQAEHSLGLATQLQRWIVGHTLCTDDSATVVSLAGPNLTAPFYLCIVEPDQGENEKEINLNNKEIVSGVIENKNDITANESGEFYTELMKLEKQSLVPNIEPFECGVCMEECAAGAGVVLRECIHTFCRECLSDVVQHCQEPAVPCPATGCSGHLQEREIRTIVTSEEYERWLARGLATAECGTRNAFHCRTRDCSGWAFCDPGVRKFPCPVCKKTNCVQCQAIHEEETCEQYQTKLREAVTAAETNKDDEGTQALLNSLISRGEALECPECRAIITKKWGCDWLKCSACKTEICWVTKGRRWGPGGRGDTSGGCRCGVDGQRCHPSCGYCH